MAHPLRLRMLELLRDAPSTATKLAAELGESTGSTSYHLRALARAGLIEDDPSHGNGRERWWRRTTLVYVPTDSEDPETQAIEAEARLVHVRRDEQALARFNRVVDELSSEWRGAAFTGSFMVYLNAEEALAFGLDMLKRFDELRRPPEERPPDARRVLLTFRALPWIDDGELP